MSDSYESSSLIVQEQVHVIRAATSGYFCRQTYLVEILLSNRVTSNNYFEFFFYHPFNIKYLEGYKSTNANSKS